MKKVNVTIICLAEEEYPGCADLVESYPEIHLVASCSALDEAGLCNALENSEVLLLDQAVVEVEGAEKVRTLHHNHPGLRSLLIIEKNCEINAMAAISLGIRGMMERVSMVSMLRKAIAVLYSGEAWVSRDMVQLLQIQSKYLNDRSVWLAHPVTLPECGKFN